MSRILIIFISSVVLSVFGGAAFFYVFENNLNEGVGTYADALWFAVGTATLLGLGDILPVTWGGRLISIGLVMFGFFFFASFSTFAAWHMLQRVMAKRRNRIIIDVTPDSELDDAMEDLRHLTHLTPKRLSKLEKIFERVFKREDLF